MPKVMRELFLLRITRDQHLVILGQNLRNIGFPADTLDPDLADDAGHRFLV